MIKSYLNKGISTPIAISIILVLVILVSGFTWWQYSEIQKEEICIGDLEDCKGKKVKIVGVFKTSKGCMGSLFAENYEGDETQRRVLLPEFAQKCEETEKYSGKKVEVIGVVEKEECLPTAQCWGGMKIKKIESIKIIDETAGLKICSSDSDCICCDMFISREKLVTEDYKELFEHNCVNKDYSERCGQIEHVNAFCAVHHCECENNRCITIPDCGTCKQVFLSWCEECQSRNWPGTGEGKPLLNEHIRVCAKECFDVTFPWTVDCYLTKETCCLIKTEGNKSLYYKCLEEINVFEFLE